LGISERTVEFHLKNVYAKLQVNSRVELILLLGKAVGSNVANLREAAVDVFNNNVQNGKQPNQDLKNIMLTINKEFAMLKNVILESGERFLDNHPRFFLFMLFLFVSFLTRSLVIEIGLYFWFSYLVLGVILLAGSGFLGVLWHKMARKENQPRPYRILGLALTLPVLVALVDGILRYLIAKRAGSVSITIAGISNTIKLMTLPNGDSYFYTERFLSNDHLWLYTLLGILLSFLFGFLINRQKDQEGSVAF
jgi:hypothetical protein